MHAVPEPVEARPPDHSGASAHYDAFLSYTHEDRPVATGIQKALHGIGRRVGQLRALRVYRDDTNLEASPDLWGKITAAMQWSHSMIVVLSPKAAQSKWVNAEVTYWLQERHGPQPMLVLAAGHLDWDATNLCFDSRTSDAAPPVLTQPGALPAEPFFIDVSGDGPPWTHTAGPFRDKMTAVAAPLHGKAKDQLVSDDLQEQRRFRRLRAAAVAGLAVLTVIAIVAGGIALAQRRSAIEQRDEAVAARLTAEANSMLNDNTSGNDVQAFQQLLAARTITQHPDDGALYNAVVAKANVLRIIDTGAPAYGGATSPDHKRIVIGGGNKEVRIWDLQTGQPVGSPLVGHEDVVRAVAWSSDGRTIATASADKSIRLWNADTGKQIGEPGGHDGIVNAVAFSLDGTLVASASADSTVRLWEVRDSGPHLVALLRAHVGEVFAVAFSPNGTRLASVGTDAVVRLWDVASRQPIDPPFEQQFTALLGVSWSPDNVTLATAGWDGLIRLWNADTGEQIGKLEGHRAAVINTVFTTDGRWLVSGSFDKTVRLWNVASRQQLADSLTGWDGGVAVNVASEGHIAAVSNDHTIRVLDILKGQPLASHSRVASAVAFSPDRDLFASGSWDGLVALWTASTNSVLRALTDPGQPVTAVLFGPEGRLVVGRADATVEVWDSDDAHTPPRIIRPCWPMGGIAISPDGKLLATACTTNESVQLWDLDPSTSSGPVEIQDPRGSVSAVAFSPDGKRFASASGKTIQLWDVASRAPIGSSMTGHQEFVDVLRFGRRGDRLVSAGRDNTLHLWDVEKGTSISETPPEGNAITAMDFSSDGEHVVSASVEGAVRLWSVADDELRPIGSPMSRHKGMVPTIDFSPDGARYLSGSTDTMLRMWPAAASPDDLCAKLSANMTTDQWDRWVSREIRYRKPCAKLP
jgi:WD40 repeat protein